jgi:inner membrane transporter RhtA
MKAVSDRTRGVTMVLLSAVSGQGGSGIGAHAFPVLGPVATVGIRQLVTTALMLPLVRPPWRQFTRTDWAIVSVFALIFAVMNSSLYLAVDRIGLGLAVTLEFLGPLGVALVDSRRLLDLLCAGLAAVGVYVLVLPGASTDWLGIGVALLAACCWAAYILLTKVVIRRLPGLQGTATAGAMSACLLLPFTVHAVATHVTILAIGSAVVAGVLSSAIPYALDVGALRLLPRQLFGVLMSVHPLTAALAGSLILGEALALHELFGILLVAASNAVAISAVAVGDSMYLARVDPLAVTMDEPPFAGADQAATAHSDWPNGADMAPSPPCEDPPTSQVNTLAPP